jgi:hypothetical protein
MKTKHGRGVCTLTILAALAVFTAVSCLGPTGIEVKGLTRVYIQQGVIWKGQAAGHAAAFAAWGAPEKDWMYRSTKDNCVYQHDGVDWVVVGNSGQGTVQTNILISGGYAATGSAAYVPVRAYFTNGYIADGYVDDMNGAVMLYNDSWNDPVVQGSGLMFHTLQFFMPADNKIPLGRMFDNETIELNMDAQGELQFRAAIEHPSDPYDPDLYYPIDTAGELALMGRTDALNGKYVLMRTLNLLGAPVPASYGFSLSPVLNWATIGIQGLPFTGVFDAGGNYIIDLYNPDGWPGGFLGALTAPCSRILTCGTAR